MLAKKGEAKRIQVDATDIAGLTQAGLNLIQQALSIYDSELTFVVGNRAFQTMFNLPDRLVTPGARFDETIRHLVVSGEYGAVQDVEAFVQARVDQALAFAPHYVERTRANGRVISVEGAPLPQGGWVAVYTDITAIKRQEDILRTRSEELSDRLLAHTEELSQANRELGATNAALEEAKRQLTQMEARARVTAEMMPAHIARMGRDWRYSYSNRQLGSVLPDRPRDIVGLHVRAALGEEAFHKIEPNLHQAMAGDASVIEFRHDVSGRRVRAAFTPDMDETGVVSGIYVLSMDVTEEAQARAALNQTRKRALAAQLTSGLAHDFSNLLTIILGLQARLAQMALPDEAEVLIDATTGAARRGGALLERLATLAGARTARPQAVNVRALLDEIQTMARPALPDTISLVTEVAGLDAPVMLDQGMVQDGLLNLVLNAKDAIGDVPGEIRIAAREVAGTWVEIEVTDTGPGFSDEALDHALDAFFTTKGGEGSGLGLAMVYDQAKLVGGQVRVSNRAPGASGACVTMRLPLKPAMPGISPRLVLLVEDQEEIRASVREMLIALGHQVIEAETAEEAQGLAGLEGIGLVLSDIMLGAGMTGDRLKTVLNGAGIAAPVLLMSSLPETDARRVGPVLTKPFTQGQLAGFLAREVPK